MRRIVITGLGTINPVGDDPEIFYRNLLDGKSGISRWRTLDTADLECQIGGDLGDYDWKSALDQYVGYFEPSQWKSLRKLFRNTSFAARLTLLVTLQAWKDADLFARPPLDRLRVGVLAAGHNINSNYAYNNYLRFLEDKDSMSSFFSVEGLDPNLPSVVSEVFGLHGPMYTLGAACASGNIALRQGFMDIGLGEAEMAVVVGAPFDLSPADLYASVMLNAIVLKPRYQNDPTRASRPFDKGRCGFLYSHGSAAIVLESLESAEARGARVYAELLGVSANANGSHMPLPSHSHQARAMKNVLEKAGVAPEEVDYINCHATSTREGDLHEILALKETFGDHIRNLKLNAPKSMTGHTCWASPLVEMVGAVKQMEYGKLHPTINLEDPIPEVEGLELCANKVVEHRIEVFLKNSFGFGGINSCSLIRRFHG